MYAPKHQRVLFVDDEEGVRRSWSRFLAERGFDVTTAEDGERAINYMREKPMDVVVSDLRMPGLDGLQLLQWTHEKQPDARFILFTGYGNDEIERKARELGAFDYLNKPISPETLAAVITAATQLKLTTARAAPAQELKSVVENPTLPAVDVLKPSRMKNALKITGGLIMAPILGLGFVLFLPVLGFALFFKVVAEAVTKRAERVEP
jgi:DNA-binding NtrC family response regulator